MRKTIKIMAIVLICGILGNTAWADLKAHYEFNGNANDSTGVHHGVTLGNTSYVNDAKRGSVAFFDGSGDYIIIPNHTDFTTNTLTVCAWVKGYDQDRGRVFTHYDHGDDQRSWQIGTSSYVCGVYDRLITALSDDGTLDGIKKQYYTEKVAFDGAWHHIAMTFDGPSSSVKLYVDGIMDVNVIKRIDESLYTIKDSTVPLTIGCDLNSGVADHFYTGYIDDVRFYDRVLNDSEVMAIVPEPATLILFTFGALILRRKK